MGGEKVLATAGCRGKGAGAKRAKKAAQAGTEDEQRQARTGAEQNKQARSKQKEEQTDRVNLHKAVPTA